MSGAARLALAACLVSGCSPDVPDTLRYRVELGLAPGATAPGERSPSEELQGYDGWQLLAGDEVLGVVHAGRRGVSVEFDRPADQRPSRFAQGLSVRVDGACGPVVQALPNAEAMDADADSDDSVAQRMDHFGDIAIYHRLAQVDTRVEVVRVAWGDVTEGTLHVGQTAVQPGTDEAPVVTLGCGGAVPVRWNDRAIGTLSFGAGAPLITVDPDACHRFASQTFGNRHGDLRREQLIRGAAVTALPGAIDFWMEPLPETVRAVRSTVPGGDTIARRTELVRLDCPPEAPEPVLAGDAEDADVEAPAPTAAASPADRRRERVEEALRRRRTERDAPELPSEF